MKTTLRDSTAFHEEQWFPPNGGPAVSEVHYHRNDFAFCDGVTQYKEGENMKTKKDIAFVHNKEAVKNIADAVVKTRKGELQFNTTRGIPYFQNVFRVDTNYVDWYATVVTSLSRIRGVTNVRSLGYGVEKGPSGRDLKYKVEIETEWGEVGIQ